MRVKRIFARKWDRVIEDTSGFPSNAKIATFAIDFANRFEKYCTDHNCTPREAFDQAGLELASEHNKIIGHSGLSWTMAKNMLVEFWDFPYSWAFSEFYKYKTTVTPPIIHDADYRMTLDIGFGKVWKSDLMTPLQFL